MASAIAIVVSSAISWKQAGAYKQMFIANAEILERSSYL